MDILHISSENHHKLGLHWIKWSYFIKKKILNQDVLGSYHSRIRDLSAFAKHRFELALFKQQLSIVWTKKNCRKKEEAFASYEEAVAIMNKAKDYISDQTVESLYWKKGSSPRRSQ